MARISLGKYRNGRNTLNHANRFDNVPQVKRALYNFKPKHTVTTSMDVGKLYPIEFRECVPGDIWRSSGPCLSKLAYPFIRPVMDDIYLDRYEFFVPLRLCQENFDEIFGDSNPLSYYDDQSLADIAHFTNNTGSGSGNLAGTVSDYIKYYNQAFGSSFKVPAGFSVLPYRAFALIWNEWFRNEQTMDPVNVHLDGTVQSGEMPNANAWSATNYTGKLPPVSRYKEYFSTSSITPQKGQPVIIPISNRVDPNTGNPVLESPIFDFQGLLSPGGTVVAGDASGMTYPADYHGIGGSSGFPSEAMQFYNPGTINDLRLAYALQAYKERDLWYGTRIKEYYRAAFGVQTPDNRAVIPEFLSHSHTRLNVSQVLTTTQSTDYEAGQVAGTSSTLTSPGSCSFRKFIPEHGYIVTVACIRYKHTYSQGIPRMFSRIKREHFPDPLFYHLGMQAVYKSEIFAQANDDARESILGYQEAFAELRTSPDYLTGQMRPSSGSLGQFWSLGDSFVLAPSLIDLHAEDDSSFKRVISVPDDDTVDPFIVQFGFDDQVARVLSPYGYPGQSDHTP